MGVRINFDSTHNAQSPTFVLATRSGRKLGQLPACNIVFKDTLNSYSEIFFRVYKADCEINKIRDKFINMNPINISSIISEIEGYTMVGSIAVNKYRELIEYALMNSYVSNLFLRFNGNSHVINIDAAIISYVGEEDIINIIDIDNGTVYLQIKADGCIYINNAGAIGLNQDELYVIDLFFDVPLSTVDSNLWDQVTDFKLVYCREYNAWFEIYVELDESNHLVKNITAKSLGEAELSQINLYDIEVNTETDISREDYKPTVLFDKNVPNASLLNRIMEKAPHYKILHVDTSIANIQRTFTFDAISIYDAFQQIAKEINCLFIINVSTDGNGKISRSVSVYDLESYCSACGKRGEFSGTCTECGSENITTGYGKDTTIYVSTDNLADSIQYTTKVDSVKNCFKLTAGDDLMTATIINCNPNGSGYIWYVSDKQKEDMSTKLVSQLESYDVKYEYYQKEHGVTVPKELLYEYNGLVDKYSSFSNSLEKLPETIIGYSALMNAYYNTVDLHLLLDSSLMPSVSMQETTAVYEAAKLSSANLSPVAVMDIGKISLATANSAVLAMAKLLVDSRYQIKINESILDGTIWAGNFTVTNYSDEEDTAISDLAHIEVNDEYEKFVKQKLEKALSNEKVENADIVSLFDLDSEDFINELKKYSLSRLKSLHDSCQTCLDILIEHGIANRESWINQDIDLYASLYMPYYDKLTFIDDEIIIREHEIAIVIGAFDKSGHITTVGLQPLLAEERNAIQDVLNFESFLGEDLWLEFITYRREDTYQNDNYISDGLNNAELFKNALEFIEVAKKDIFKSATLQHSITATLKNLLAMKEFAKIVDYFEVGNWIRIRVDENVYKLRIVDYEIDYDNLSNISITFSDIKTISNGISDVESILNQAASMATSYGSVSRQAGQGKKSNDIIDSLVSNGLSLTQMKIIDNADNQNIVWDSHGILCKEYLPITDTYDDKQLKIINKGLYLTSDNWLTSRAGIGNFTFYNPETGQMEENYGVIADTLVGNLVLSEKVAVYNTSNSIVLGKNGLVITTDGTSDNGNQISFTIQQKQFDASGNEQTIPIMYVDSNGKLVLNGTININSATNSMVNTLNDLADSNRLTEQINSAIYDESQIIYSEINNKYNAAIEETSRQLNQYKSDIGQYMQFDESGLTLGAQESNFKTVIDNHRLAFKEGDAVVSYISNSQLYISDAVINNNMILGKFYFSPRTDGGVSLAWQGD